MHNNLNEKQAFAGNVEKEFEQITKMRSSVQSYLTIVTNACSGFMTWFCC